MEKPSLTNVPNKRALHVGGKTQALKDRHVSEILRMADRVRRPRARSRLSVRPTFNRTQCNTGSLPPQRVGQSGHTIRWPCTHVGDRCDDLDTRGGSGRASRFSTDILIERQLGRVSPTGLGQYRHPLGHNEGNEQVCNN